MQKWGGGDLANHNKKKGFAISGILYPILILTLFLVVQVLFMLQTRKNVLDKARTELADSVNGSNIIYTNEELSALIQDQQNKNEQLSILVTGLQNKNEQLSILVTGLQNNNKLLKTELDNTKKVVDKLSYDSGWKQLINGVNYRKIGSIGFIEFINYRPKITGWHKIGTLPSGYKTSGTRYGGSLAFNGTTANDIMVEVTESSTISIYANVTEMIVGMFVYPIG